MRALPIGVGRNSIRRNVVDTQLRRELHQGAAQIDTQDILRLIPHRNPNLMLDRVLTIVPGRHGVGVKAVSGDECGLASRGHLFVFPSTFALECLAQLAAVVDASAEFPDPASPEGRSEEGMEAAAESVRILSEVEYLKIHREMLTSEPLYLSIDLEPLDPEQPEVRWASGRALIHGEILAETRFQLRSLNAPADDPVPSVPTPAPEAPAAS